VIALSLQAVVLYDYFSIARFDLEIVPRAALAPAFSSLAADLGRIEPPKQPLPFQSIVPAIGPSNPSRPVDRRVTSLSSHSITERDERVRYSLCGLHHKRTLQAIVARAARDRFRKTSM
jgi:hypothetical protein